MKQKQKFITKKKIPVSPNSLMNKIYIAHKFPLFSKKYHSTGVLNPELIGPDNYMIWGTGCR